jgi:hypothetical protein
MLYYWQDAHLRTRIIPKVRSRAIPLYPEGKVMNGSMTECANKPVSRLITDRNSTYYVFSTINFYATTYQLT